MSIDVAASIRLQYTARDLLPTYYDTILYRRGVHMRG
jgi:hypothetical protein